MSRRQSAALVALAVVVAGWCALGIRVRATYGARLTADEPQYVLSAISLAEDRDLDIADELDAERWRAFHSPARLPVQTKVLDGGREVSPHDPLLPLVLAAPVAVAGWMGAKAALALLAGALAALVAWTAWRRLGVPFAIAVVGAGLFAMSPPMAMYGTQVYPELPAALVVLGAVAVMTAPRVEGRSTVGLVVLLTLLPWLSVKYAPVAAALAVVAGWRWWKDGRRDLVVAAGVALGVMGVAYAAVHHVVYGGWTPYAAGAHFVGGEATVMGVQPNVLGRARRLIGLLVDRDFGLVPWQPAYLFVVPAVALALGAFGEKRASCATQLTKSGGARSAVLVPLAAGWFTATFLALTMQGWWWPGRQVVVVLPLAALCVLAMAARVPRRVALAMGVVASLGLAEYLWLVVEGLQHRLTWVVDFMSTRDPLFRLWESILPNGRSIATRDLVLTGVWAAAALGTATWMWLRPRIPVRPVAAAVAAGALVVVGVAGCADDGAAVRDTGRSPGVGSPDNRS